MKKRKPRNQPQWPRIADALFLLNWRKFLLVLVIWGLTAAFTWAIFGPLTGLLGNTTGLAGNNVTDILRTGGEGLLVATWGGGVSQYDGQAWQALTTQDGLADDRVTSLAQSAAGDVWLGTYAGLSRYDGRQWRSFTTEDGLTSDIVLALAADADDNVWVGTAEGLAKYDRASGDLTPISLGESPPVINTVYVDNSGMVWVGTADRGLFIQDGTEWQNVTTADGLANEQVGVIYQDSQGDVWVGTIDGLSRYDGRSWRIYTTDDGLPSNIILALAEDEAGDLLAGTNSGLALFNGDEWQPVAVGEEDVAANPVDAILVDDDGALWVGGLGLSHYDGDTWESYAFQPGIVPAVVFMIGTVVIPIYLVAASVYIIVQKQPRSRYMRVNRYTLLLIPAFIVALVLHNLVYAMFYPYFLRTGSNEGVFLMLALLAIPFYFLLIVFNTIAWLFSGRRSDEEVDNTPANDRK